MWTYLKSRYLEHQALLQRVRDLERTNEVLTGANEVLINELERSREQESLLLNKIFDFTGLNKNQSVVAKTSSKPISIGKASPTWQKLQGSLELNARKEYWENKKQNETNQRRDEETNQIDELEKQLDIAEGKSNVS